MDGAEDGAGETEAVGARMGEGVGSPARLGEGVALLVVAGLGTGEHAVRKSIAISATGPLRRAWLIIRRNHSPGRYAIEQEIGRPVLIL